jgi:hypothetical protein
MCMFGEYCFGAACLAVYGFSPGLCDGNSVPQEIPKYSVTHIWYAGAFTNT